MSDISSSIRRRLLVTNSTASALALTSGMYTITTLAAALSLTAAQARERFLPLGPSLPSVGARRRGAEISVIGVGSANQTASVRIWQAKYGVSRSAPESQTLDFELCPIATVAAILGACAGAASGELVASTELIADTLTVTKLDATTTPKGIHDHIVTTYGGVAVTAYSPADDTPGRVTLADVGNGDLFFELIVGTATSANLIVEALS